MKLGLSVLAVCAFLATVHAEISQECGRIGCEYQLIEKLLKLEQKNKDLEKRNRILEEKVEALDDLVRDKVYDLEEKDKTTDATIMALRSELLALIDELEPKPESYWSSWSSWSSCTSQCEDGFNRRTQSRARTQVCNGNSQDCNSTSEIESRPCNNVEYAGSCATAKNDTTVYGLAFSPYDEMAIAICAASQSGAYIQAVRRDCGSGHAPDCNTICSSMGSGHTCFNAVHAYKHRPVLQADPTGREPDQGKPGLRAFHYGKGGCGFTNTCGPNFCCCRSPNSSF